MFRRSILALLLLFVLPVYAQSSKKVPVVVEHSGNDNVGQRLAFEVRETIRGSQSMRLVTATEANPRISVILVTIDPDRQVDTTATAVSVSITYDADTLSFQGYFITSSVLVCGALRTRGCARDLVAKVDGAIEQLRRDYPARWERLQR